MKRQTAHVTRHTAGMRAGFGLVSVSIALLLLAPRLLALGPTVLMFYGAPLKKPVLVTGADTREFGEELLRPIQVAPVDPARPYISVALYYGQASDPAGNGVPIDKLTPEMAWQHARFYPATATSPATMRVAAFMKMAAARGPTPVPTNDAAFNGSAPVSPAALAVLQRLGIPVGPAR